MTPDLPGTLVIGVICLSLMSLALCLHLGRRAPRRRRTATRKAPLRNNTPRNNPARNRMPRPDVTSGFRDPYR